MWRRRRCGTGSKLLASCYPPQSNLLSADEQGSSILFSNLFALLSPDIYTHFCLVARYLHLPTGEEQNIFQRQMLLQRSGCCSTDEEGSNWELEGCLSPEGPGSRNISPGTGAPKQALGDPAILQQQIVPIWCSKIKKMISFPFVVLVINSPSVPI